MAGALLRSGEGRTKDGAGESSAGQSPRSTNRSEKAPAGPYRGEQRGQVVGEVVERRVPELVAPGHPGGEGERLPHGNETVRVAPDEHHPGGQGVAEPLLGGVRARRSPGAVDGSGPG